MIVLIGGEKGGTGKTTLATNLAVCLAHRRRDVLLLDADRQATAASWANERSREQGSLPPVHCVQKYGNLYEPVRDLASRYQDIIIDAGGRDSEELRTAMVVADSMFSPIRASQSDLWTIEHLQELVKLARGFNRSLLAHVILSMAPTNPRVREADDANAFLGDFEVMAIATSVIRDRKVFRDAMVEGRGVVEMADRKAHAEVEAFVTEVLNGEVQTRAGH